MSRPERWHLVVGILAMLVGLILFLLLVPVLCVVRFADPGPTFQHCSSVVTGLLESELGKPVPTWASALGALIIPPAGGWLIWYLLRRLLTQTQERWES